MDRFRHTTTLERLDIPSNIMQTFIVMSVLAKHLVVSVVEKRGDALRHVHDPTNPRNAAPGAAYSMYTRFKISHNHTL
jgi:hypothetical protein